MKPVKIVLGFIALASVTACGLKGDLERPEPIFRKEQPPAPAPAEPPVSSSKPTPEQDVPDDELLGGPLD
ncbi:LPS translocon maturation chaperone LptM [Hirschia litorea]|uniref:Lipoprotein n=1 Tax=Hirschia litorea TaxID=1199156 RepID=A0ABW2IMG4_9PROT